MTLTAGTKLGPYELGELLGSGGMGEVYRARDPRIGRDVAVKVLPSSFSANADRLHRFEQEARAVGALNHPNLVTLFELGRHDGAPYIVMELLEGESLRQKLGPDRPQAPGTTSSRISLRKAADYGAQIASGLAAAHERGIIHRDLKPENVFVTKDGRVKILDFGLAKLTTGGSDATDAPTQQRDTAPGTVMGTAGYMSPEQVRGHEVDHRADIFSFGAILYEMLSGRRAFHGDSAADTMSAILREDPPDLSQSLLNCPPALERIVMHCLEKNPEERFQSARDLAFDLGALSESSESSTQRFAARPRRRVPIAATAIAVILAFLGGIAVHRWATSGKEPEVARVRYFSFSGHDSQPSASPDGKTIAFASHRDGRRRIWIKQIVGGDEVALTEGEDDFPRFSPDGSSILFTRTVGLSASLYKVPVVGGEPRKVVSDAGDADWSPDGRQIAFVRFANVDQAETHLVIANADGSSPRTLFKSAGLLLIAPRFSPDGKTIAVSQTSLASTQPGSVIVVDVDSGRMQTIQVANGQPSSVAWLPGGEEIVYARIESVTNVRFAPASIVRHHVRRGTSRALFSVPSSGTRLDLLPDGRLVTDTPLGRQNLREIPLHGSGQARWLTRGNCTDRQPAFSPDGDWVIFSSDRSGNLDLWTVSRKTGAVRRITDDAADDWDPAYTPDGKQILWSSNRTGHFEIWIADADGSGARQLTNDGFDAENPTMSRSGLVVYTSANPKSSGIWRINRDGSGAKRIAAGVLVHPEMSPDGEWVLYHVQSLTDDENFAVRLSDGRVYRLAGGYLGKGSSAAAASLGRGRWMPDGRQFIFVGRDDESRVGVYIQDFDPGRDTTPTRRKLAGFDAEYPTESLGASPDGNAVVLSDNEPLSVLSIVEGLSELAK